MKWRAFAGRPMRTLLIIWTALLPLSCSHLSAQRVRLSQHGSVSQEIGDTSITIEYNRPVARGRELFGALVPWGRIWCPGADECTSIQLSTAITVNGQKLAAGHYTLWAEPN